MNLLGAFCRNFCFSAAVVNCGEYVDSWNRRRVAVPEFGEKATAGLAWGVIGLALLVALIAVVQTALVDAR